MSEADLFERFGDRLTRIQRADYRAVEMEGKRPVEQAAERDVASTTVSRNVERAAQRLAEFADETDDSGLSALEFDLLGSDSGSVERARETPAVIEPQNDPGTYVVEFEDSEHTHQVVLLHNADGWRGNCSILDSDGTRVGHCRGLLYHAGPCAHLWAVRSEVAAVRLAEAEAAHYDKVDRNAEDFGGNPRFNWKTLDARRFSRDPRDGLRFPWSRSGTQNNRLSHGDGGRIWRVSHTPPSRRGGVGSRATARAVIRDSESARGRGDFVRTTVSRGGGDRGVF
jgi:hypothetical protein